MLTISVKNFGPIAEGSVDLKPLTIFVGPSNTGKSYMATAVYAVMQATGGRGPDSRKPRISRPMSFFDFASKELEEGINALEKWVVQRVQEKAASQIWTVSDLPEKVRLYLANEVLKELDFFQKCIAGEISRIHGEQVEFIRHGSDAGNFCLGISRNNALLNTEVRITDTAGSNPPLDISQMVVTDHIFDTLHYMAEIEEYSDDYRISAVLSRIVASAVYLEFHPQSYYLPAARSGIVQGHKVLSASLVRQSSLAGLRELHIPALPRITTDFLSYMIGLDSQMRSGRLRSDLQDAISFIETDVIRGKIDLDLSAGLPTPDIVYLQGEEDSSQKKFSLNQTSSMVSELAPLVLFLKYLVRPGDLLILEEPESHLHPAAQRQLARGIARLVNADVKVLITTHSDLFVSQINNQMRISFASKRWLRENGFEPQECLRHDDVSAYLFRWDDELGGSVVNELEIRRDVGIDDDMFGEVINAIYEEALLVQRIRPKWE